MKYGKNMSQKRIVEFIESYIKHDKDGDYQWNDNHGELIRCCDCKHYNTDLEGFGFCMKGNLVHSRNGEKAEHPDGYCSESERKEENE